MATEPVKLESNPLMTVAEIARGLNVSTNTIYYWVGRNEIPFVKIGKHLRFIARDVIQFFREKTEGIRPTCLRTVPPVKDKNSFRSLKIGDTIFTPEKE